MSSQVPVDEEVSVEALEALRLARARSGSEEKFLEDMDKLENAIREEKAKVVGNLCILGTGCGHASNKEKIAVTLTDHPDRFVAVLIDSRVQAISPESTVVNSALIESSVHGGAVITNSVLAQSVVWGETEIHDSYLYMTIMQDGAVSHGVVRGVDQVIG